MRSRRRNAGFISIIILVLAMVGASFFLLNRARVEARALPANSPAENAGQLYSIDDQAPASGGFSVQQPVRIEATHTPTLTEGPTGQAATAPATLQPTPQETPEPTSQPTPSPTTVLPQQTPGFVPNPDDKIKTCADIWQVSEIPFDLPEVINFPPSIDSLATDINYYYLAAMLIQNKAVDASSCPFNGLLTATSANECGAEIAKPFILNWQNQYDTKIFETGVKYGVPSRLIKKVFALESQFWPGIYIDITESGLGQLNELGADALLMYNSHFFGQFCPLILSQSTCDQGYLGIGSSGRAILRGALVRQVDASCKGCSMGIDTDRALNSIPIFADLIKANCSQVDQIIYNDTEKKSGSITDYVDLWKITMANYNAGPGCIDEAVNKAWINTGKVTWDTVQNYLTSDQCSGAKFYVGEIFK